MKQMIPICLINLIPNDYNEQYHQEIHITNCEIIKNIQESVGKLGIEVFYIF